MKFKMRSKSEVTSVRYREFGEGSPVLRRVPTKENARSIVQHLGLAGSSSEPTRSLETHPDVTRTI